MQKFSLGFSPCPNDTFIFDALYHKKIDTKGYHFDFIIEDVEKLNKRALNHNIDITKISFASYALCSQYYQLSSAGSALGKSCGPLLISKNQLDKHSLSDLSIGIPGFNTTANLLLNIAFPNLKNKKEMLFSEIENALLKNEIDLGLIIHENRFTYQSKGLHLIRDLGEYWEETSKQSIPLGGIAISRKIDPHVQQEIQSLIKKSIAFAFSDPESSLLWTKSHSQEIKNSVIKQHIELYVNQYSIELGSTGKKSIRYLLKMAQKVNWTENISEPIFIG